MDRRSLQPIGRLRGRGRAGFTLVELLVVLTIVSIIAAVTLPVVIPAISHRQVSESARIIQGGLVAARDSALRTNTPHGIRFLPDPVNNGINPAAPAGIDPFRTLASNRFVPIEQPPGYSEGKVFAGTPGMTDPMYWDNDPQLAADGAYGRALLSIGRVLMLVQAVFEPSGGLEPPTSWYWNIRVGDKVRINDQGKLYTVVGPMETRGADNPQMFVNIGSYAGTLKLTHPATGEEYYPEILFLSDGVDNDADGYVDNGWDGLDNDGNGDIDDLGEWTEVETWPTELVNGGMLGRPSPSGLIGGVPYQVVRQPVPSPGARETMLPDSVVVDMTGWALSEPERSRLPVDRRSGTVDILLEPSGRVVPTTRYSSPSSFGMNESFYHIWIGERTDLAELTSDGKSPPSAVPLAASPVPAFYLPKPQDAYDAFDPSLVGTNPTLPILKGEMRLLTLSTRTGNMITTDRPAFVVGDPSRPFHAPQLGEQGDAP